MKVSHYNSVRYVQQIWAILKQRTILECKEIQAKRERKTDIVGLRSNVLKLSCKKRNCCEAEEYKPHQ